MNLIQYYYQMYQPYSTLLSGPNHVFIAKENLNDEFHLVLTGPLSPLMWNSS